MRLGRKAGSGARKAGRELKKGKDNPWLERSARLGYVVRGLLYGAMGVFGMGFAVGLLQTTTDQRGALALLRGNPFAVLVFAAVVVGLLGYSLWGFIRAVYDPLHRGDDVQGIAARLGFAWSGLSYAGLLVVTVQFMVGRSKGEGTDSVTSTIAFIMAHPFGIALTVVIGVIAVLMGLGQFVDGVRAGFRKDMKRSEMSKEEERIAEALGRFGMFARGVIFTLLGAFIIQAAIKHDPSRAHGMGAAFQDLAREPGGHLLLFVVSAGFVALGLHSIASARWIRMAGRRGPHA
jgi:hypothetical protein